MYIILIKDELFTAKVFKKKCTTEKTPLLPVWYNHYMQRLACVYFCQNLDSSQMLHWLHVEDVFSLAVFPSVMRNCMPHFSKNTIDSKGRETSLTFPLKKADAIKLCIAWKKRMRVKLISYKSSWTSSLKTN